MRKLIVAGMAVAMLAVIPAAASANVERHQTQTGKLTVTLPEYNLVHTFTDVVVNPCDGGSFTGVSGTRDVGEITEEVTGTIKGGKIAFDATYTSQQENGYNWHTIGSGEFGDTFRATDSNNLDFDVIVKSGLTSSNYKNHGEYVKSQGGGSDAAHSCIGKPINSNG